jgi:hypothetical protein
MDRAFRCSPWTRAQGVDPIGSATPFDALLLVEWPLPWPQDVSAIEPLAEAAADPRAMVMAVVPQPGTPEGVARVVHHRRVGTHVFAGVDHLVPRSEVPALLARLLEDPAADHLDLPSAVGVAPTDVLVCGHGRRDPCCGRFGTLLQAEVAVRLPHARVWRCSHTGGHRFAPTAITVTEGRAWAYLDADLLIGIVERTVDVAALAGHDRGSVALGPWAQAAEHELFATRGWAWLDAEVTDAQTEVAADGRSARVVLAWQEPSGAGHRAEAEVIVTRVVPVLVCGEPPEQAKKSSNELAVTSLQIT